jgi:hypothetical protein
MNMRQKTTIARLLFIVLCVSLMVGSALSAFAEPVTSINEVRVAAQMLQGAPMIFVAATIDDSVALPAQVPVAVPNGAQMEWVGELAGGEAAEDPETTFTLLETRDGWDIYLVDLVDSRTVQIEATINESFLVATGENTGTATFTYVPATDVGALTVAVETPPDLAGFDENAGYEVFGQGIGGGMIIGPTFSDAKAGEPYTASFSYTTASTTDEDANSSGVDSFRAVLIVLVLALLILIALLFFIVNRQRGGRLVESVTGNVASHKEPREGGSHHKGKTHRSARKGFRWNSPQALMLVLIALAAIGLLVWTSQRNAHTITNNGGVFSQVFAVGDPCASVEFTLTDAALQDPEATARELFTLMRTADIQLLGATLDSNRGTLFVEFCESYTQDEQVAALIETTGLVAGSSLKTLNLPIVRDGGYLMWYFAQIYPCATNAFEIADPGTDAVAFLGELAGAVRSVPSITGVAYHAANGLAEFGFCEEQADDEMISDALAAAGIGATLKVPTLELTDESIFARY